MRAISRWLDRFCYNHPRFGIPNLIKYVIFGQAAVFLLDMVSGGTFSQILAFYPSLILKGQVWRLVTFVFVPENLGSIWFVFSAMLYYFLGSALERQWGTTRFTVFYLLGVVLNVIAGLVIYVAVGQPYYAVTATIHYVNLSLFLAFATLYPDTQFVIYFIIPIKVKWLAWLDVAFFAIGIFQALAGGQVLWALTPIVSIFNYLIFFWEDLMELLGRGCEMDFNGYQDFYRTYYNAWAAEHVVQPKD